MKRLMQEVQGRDLRLFRTKSIISRCKPHPLPPLLAGEGGFFCRGEKISEKKEKKRDFREKHCKVEKMRYNCIYEYYKD